MYSHIKCMGVCGLGKHITRFGEAVEIIFQILANDTLEPGEVTSTKKIEISASGSIFSFEPKLCH